MSSLDNSKPRPAQHIENGHDSALRDGRAFIFHHEADALASDAEVFVRITTGDSAIVFEAVEFGINEEAVLFEMYEDVVFSSPGSVDTTFTLNMNRIKSDKDTELTLYTSPVVDTLGARVLHEEVKGVAGLNLIKPGFGTGTQANALVLKPNTEHVFTIKNNSVLAVDVETHFYYHEVTPNEYQ